MISFEIAKKLHDSGFVRPIKLASSSYVYQLGGYDQYGVVFQNVDEIFEEDHDTQHYYIPTLSELIEACKSGYFMLGQGNGEWVCWAGGKKTCHGKSPEEAVANSWLELKNHE